MEQKFEINLIPKENIRGVNLERIYKWIENVGEDFIDYHFDRNIKNFEEWFASKYPDYAVSLKEFLRNNVAGVKGPVVFTFLDVMNYYEECPESFGNPKEPTEKFYEDFIEFINTNNELKAELNKILNKIDESNRKWAEEQEWAEKQKNP